MKRKTEPVYQVPEKRRIREEINQQVADFLKTGGQIDVLSNQGESAGPSSSGRRWNDPEDLLPLSD
ncbi:MAG: hypothetical protein AAF699_11505 [Pseudomonadota bacterium]